MSVNQITEDRVESQFSGSALRRLLTYVKPFWHYMAVSLLLVLLLTGLELYRPILVGDAIDDYISGYQYPYLELPEEDSLKKLSAKESETLRDAYQQALRQTVETGSEELPPSLSSERYSQMVLYGNH